MEKSLTFDVLETEPAGDEPVLANYFAQMQRANAVMKSDQLEIDRLKSETWAIANQTRTVLQQLEAKVSC